MYVYPPLPAAIYSSNHLLALSTFSLVRNAYVHPYHLPPLFAGHVHTQKPWKNPPTRAEVRIVEELYAIGEGAPAIRQQVLSVRLRLDVADQLEEMGIFDASTMTAEDARTLTDLATQQLNAEKEKVTARMGKVNIKVISNRLLSVSLFRVMLIWCTAYVDYSVKEKVRSCVVVQDNI